MQRIKEGATVFVDACEVEPHDFDSAALHAEVQATYICPTTVFGIPEHLVVYKGEVRRVINCRTEPEVKIDWSKVPPGTAVEVTADPTWHEATVKRRKFVGYFPHFNPKEPFMATSNFKVTYSWGYCRLPIDVRPDPEWLKVL